MTLFDPRVDPGWLAALETVSDLSLVTRMSSSANRESGWGGKEGFAPVALKPTTRAQFFSYSPTYWKVVKYIEGDTNEDAESPGPIVQPALLFNKRSQSLSLDFLVKFPFSGGLTLVILACRRRLILLLLIPSSFFFFFLLWHPDGLFCARRARRTMKTCPPVEAHL